jgi:hypothetical protein
MKTAAVCPLCRMWWVPTFTTHDDPRPRFSGHMGASGPFRGRECGNSGEVVSDRPYAAVWKKQVKED